MTRPTYNSHDITEVSIGIQARSTSVRFPNKVLETIGNKTVLEWIIGAAQNAAAYINKYSSKRMHVGVAILIPENDPILTKHPLPIETIKGSEDDVLSRFIQLQKLHNSKFIVRLTADCPMIPPFVISKLITIAVMNAYDYLSNVDEQYRTAPDGFDCEVISERLLKFVNESAVDARDREHVTTYIRRSPPRWAAMGCVLNHLDLSALKLSLDTVDDLERMRQAFDKVNNKIEGAKDQYGKSHAHLI